jgi:hypothetical protein
MMQAPACLLSVLCASFPSAHWAQAEHDKPVLFAQAEHEKAVLSAQLEHEKALSLADAARTDARKPRDTQIFTEVSNRLVERREGGWRYGLLLSADVRHEQNFGSGLRAVFSNRLDVAAIDAGAENTVNSLREAYASLELAQSTILDLGRINRRFGAATGYNPTDFFKTNAVRSVVSIDPMVLRENRLGTVMAGGQTVWSSGSFTAVYAPKLADKPDDGAFSPDLGSTNGRQRALVALTQRIAPDFAPQWLLYQESGQSARYGLNLTHLVVPSTVLFLEWSGARRELLFDDALGTPGQRTFRQQVAAGATYTAKAGPSITVDYDYNGAGLTRSQWDALRATPGLPFEQYVRFTAALRDSPTRHNVFTYLRWPNVLPQVELRAFVRHSVSDSSRLSWIEARHYRGNTDLALQWQRTHGAPNTENGVLPQRSLFNLVWRQYF